MRRASLYLAAAVAFAIAGYIGEAAADMQIKGATAPSTDSRRAHSGAKITAETNPQDDPSGNNDASRMDDSYQPKGIDLGQFLFLPKVDTRETYNSNIFATRHQPKSDLVTTVQPELTFRSRFDRHALNAHFQLENSTYKSFGSENHLDGSGDLDGRLDIGASSELTAFAQLYARHEDRTSPDDGDGIRPTPTRGFNGKIGGKTEQGHFTFLSDVTSRRMTFEAVPTSFGTIIPNQDRDRWEVEGRFRTSYEIFPGYSAVAQVSLNDRVYDSKLDRNGYDRNSMGYRAETGVGVDLSQLLRGDFMVGYLKQKYKDSRFTNPSGLSVRSTFNWTPDKLTLVVPSLERSVSETTTPGASALVATSGSVFVRHELARNIVLFGSASAAYEDATGVEQTDWLYEAKASVTYSFAPEVYVGGEVGYKYKDARVDNLGYKQGTVMVRLGLQL